MRGLKAQDRKAPLPTRVQTRSLRRAHFCHIGQVSAVIPMSKQNAEM
jgi:hypothetical protein